MGLPSEDHLSEPIGLEARVEGVLADMCAAAGFSLALVCTDDGLPIAASGADLDIEHLSGLTSLFDDILIRAVRDLRLPSVDEVALRTPRLGRTVVRPLELTGEPRLFLVVRVPPGRSWRRATTRASRLLEPMLAPLQGLDDAA